MATRKLLFIPLFLSALFGLATQAQQQEPETWQSENGLFSVTVESELNPIMINQIHSWTLQLTDGQQRPVSGAEIIVEGGMPEHNHGLATAPSVSSTGNGVYTLQGLRFHMMGYWELTLTISHEGITDTVLITLTL